MPKTPVLSPSVTKNVLRRLADMSPAFAKVKAMLISFVDMHFQQERGPDSKWPARSKFTEFMARRSKEMGSPGKGKKKGKQGPRVHTGLLLRDRGTFRLSFGGGAEAGKNFASVGSALKTPTGGHNLAAIHHYGVTQTPTAKQRGWFIRNFGIRLKANAKLVIPPRPVLWLSKEETRQVQQVIADFVSKG